MSRLKINFHKSKILLFGNAIDKSEDYSRIFTCPVGTLPMKYLGLPVDEKRIRNKYFKPPEEKMKKNVKTGKGDYLLVLEGPP